MSKDPEEQLKVVSEAVDMKLDQQKNLSALLCRMQIYMTQDKFLLAIEDG